MCMPQTRIMDCRHQKQNFTAQIFQVQYKVINKEVRVEQKNEKKGNQNMRAR